MIIGTITIKIFIASSRSLKDKRRVSKSLISRLQNKFNLSVAEIGSLDQWQIAEIGLALVANESRHLNRQISRIIEFIEKEQYEYELIEVASEII
ncbi:MAG: DUF503 domain-containing protein [Peptococcaceae bacterium]